MTSFNALNQEISRADRERANLETKLEQVADELLAKEEVLSTLEENYSSTVESGKILEDEIHTNVVQINEEGSQLKKQRDEMSQNADKDVLKIYDRLLNNKRDRVVVPIANRTCSGCHIQLTAQQENLVRKGERLIFCEHCSRVLFWQEAAADSTETTTKRRRRKTTAAT